MRYNVDDHASWSFLVCLEIMSITEYYRLMVCVPLSYSYAQVLVPNVMVLVVEFR
jgi:hypothetical protein